MKNRLGIGCLVGVVIVLALVMPASAIVASQGYTKYVDVVVKQPDEVRTNTINVVALEFTPKASYPVDVRVVVMPSYFAIKPEWVQGAKAIKDNTGVTFTLKGLTQKKTVRIAVPGSVLEGLNTGGKIELIDSVKVTAYPSASSATAEVHAYELATVKVSPTQFLTYNSPLDAFFPVILMVLGAVIMFAGTKFAG